MITTTISRGPDDVYGIRAKEDGSHEIFLGSRHYYDPSGEASNSIVWIEQLTTAKADWGFFDLCDKIKKEGWQ